MPASISTDRHKPVLIWLRCLPLLLFVAIGTAYFWNAQGDDLASSYMGCRLVATGSGASLYSYDPVNFAAISDADPLWPRLAAQGGYRGSLHPYVQTPLWAWLLQPVCAHTQWPAFKHLFLALSLLSIAGCLWLVARYWTPGLWSPAALTVILVALFFSEPFLFAMELVQTHALLLFLTIAGIVLAQRNRPLTAGFCVACAAAVKITPGVLVVYWLVTRRWRAALSLVGWSALLMGFTRLAVGASLFHAFLDNMHRVSGVLLVSENNQSLAAWYMERFFLPDEVFDVNAFALPSLLRLLSITCMIACAALGGLLDSTFAFDDSTRTETPDAIPFGAGIALVAMTVFAPIAWTHYFIVLAIPLMMLAEAAFALRPQRVSWTVWIAVFAIGALLYRPLAPDVIRMDLSDYAVLRGVFYAGVLCTATLAGIGWRMRARETAIGASSA